MTKPELTVVIPCYNQGHYLYDALESLATLDKSLVEILIVNDGSTDQKTLDILDGLMKDGYRIINQENQGLGGARNTGIRNAAGQYILPLDADNKIRPDYISKGIGILDAFPEVAVVYGNSSYFGDKTGIFKPGKYNLQRIMMGNYIDACAVIRKSVIEEVGFYENMKIMGLEDWDLWLRISFAGHKFYYVDEVLFDYRVSSGSMIHTLNKDIEKQNAVEEYFKTKYADKLDFEFVMNYFVGRMKRRPFHFMYRLVLKKFFPGKFQRMIRNNKIYNGWLYDRS